MKASKNLVNYNELILPIDFKSIADKHGVRKGSIFYSDTFKSWVLSGHEDIDLICIDAPFKNGDVLEGKEVKSVTIRSNSWFIKF